MKNDLVKRLADLSQNKTLHMMSLINMLRNNTDDLDFWFGLILFSFYCFLTVIFLASIFVQGNTLKLNL